MRQFTGDDSTLKNYIQACVELYKQRQDTSDKNHSPQFSEDKLKSLSVEISKYHRLIFDELLILYPEIKTSDDTP